MLQVDVGQVEVYPLHQQVGGDEHFFIGIAEYGAVIAYAVLCAFVLILKIFCQSVNQTELS